MLKQAEASRTAVGGVRYCFVDFGLATRDQSLTTGFDGQVRAPELSKTVPYIIIPSI